MRRGKPLRRKKALPRNTKPIERRTPLPRSTTPLKRTPIKPISARRRVQVAWTKMEADAHHHWREKVIRNRCAVCALQGREHDSHHLHDPHHILPARYIRRFVRTKRRELHLDVDETKRLLLSLMYDPRNGMSLDRRCHDKHEKAFFRVPREAIPRKAWQFAAELEMTHVLERLYPA